MRTFVHMLVKELSLCNYSDILNCPTTLYSTAAFCNLNHHKVYDIRCLSFCNENSGKVIAGIILGRKEDGGQWLSPFSAPFGGLDATRKLRIEEVRDIYRALINYCGGRLRVVLPPAFYNPALVSQQIYAIRELDGHGTLWLNHSYDLSAIGNYEANLNDTARKHLRRALKEGYEVDCDAAIDEAYGVIAKNRAEHGYQLAMTLEELVKTAKIIPQHSVVIRLDKSAVAAAVCYRLSDDVMQIIYWGHLAGCQGKYPMSILARSVFEYAARVGCSIVDIGPSTSSDAPNDSLAAFKESLGATATLKFIGEWL